LQKKRRVNGGRPPLLETRLERVTFTLHPETIEKLGKVAKATERSLSFVAREALRRYFEAEPKAAA
jgi:predicted transcriptional regulator